MQHLRLILFILFLGFIASCAPARYVKPLEKGQTSIGCSLGGPLISFSSLIIPMPLTSIVVGHGFKNDLTGFAGLHTTSLAFGVFQTDIGIVKQVYQQMGWIPGITISPVANLMIDRWQGKLGFFPQIDVNAYWNYLQKPHYAYIGVSNWFDISATRAEGDAQNTHWFPLLQLGNTFVKGKWSFTIEMKYAFYVNSPVVVDYIGIGKNNAIGVYFGVSRHF